MSLFSRVFALRLSVGSRTARVTAGVIGLGLVASLATAAGPVGAAPRPYRGPAAQTFKAVAHGSVQLKPFASPPAPTTSTPAISWPSGTAMVSAAAPTTARTALTDSAFHRAGQLPIELAPATRTALTASVSVATHASALRAGVNGLLVSITPHNGSTVGAVAIDYAGLAGAAGGAWATRLHLVSLPGCALTTPQLPSCQTQTAIPGQNRTAQRQVTATPSPAAGSRPMVVAAVSGASGANGTFTASSLAPSGSWSAGGSTGSFSWNYPIVTPTPATGGDVAPKISLNYNSASVDGRISSTNNQPSWLGEGWDYSPGYVERTYRTCADDPNGTTTTKTADLCWAGQILTFNLNGKSTAIVYDGTNFHPASDDGERIEHLTGSGNGARNGEYWRITTADGVQYNFGRNAAPGRTTQALFNSTWTVPVYNPHAGDDCYNATFSASSCTEAWRWNLDYVEDPHGNVTTYTYTPETNYYGNNGGTSGVVYTRGGYLTTIDYGLRDENNTIYASVAPDEVSFKTQERCLDSTTICTSSNFNATNASHWKDTPQDQNCASGATCNNHAPTFWSTKRLASIETDYNTGSGNVKLDTYDFGQSWPTGGDTELQLSSITRTGYNAAGVAIAMPAISFASNLYENRVPGYNGQIDMAHWRLTTIHTDTGSTVSVTYAQPTGQGCDINHMPADPSQDGTLCFPVYWQPDYRTAPILDYFMKYVVISVQTDDPNAISPSQLTSYSYLGPPAWHYDDNEVVKPSERTWGQFRGYQQVDTSSGNTGNNSANGTADKQTLTRTTFFRGMNGDTLPNGQTRQNITVPDSLSETTPDTNQFAGSTRETQTFDGVGGTQLSTAITDYGVIATTATRARTGLPALTATIVRPTKVRTITAIVGTSPAGTQATTKTSAYDSLGRVTQLTESGDTISAVCTTTSYADNTTSWIRTLTSEVIKSSGACSGTPPTVAATLSDTRTYYDGAATLGGITGPGNITRTDAATSNNSGTLHFAKTTQTWDAAGRTTGTTQYVSSTDTTGRTTSIAYTPADGGPLQTTTTTNALNQSATSTIDPGRQVTLALVDIAGHRTDAVYDSLGRLTSLWKPGQRKSLSDPATTTYSYVLRSNGPPTVTTQNLVDVTGSTHYVTSVTLYDAFGDVRQTQTDAEGGGIIITDSIYDSHGWKVRSNNHWYTTGTPGATILTIADSACDSWSTTTYDGTGRPTKSTNYRDTTVTDSTSIVYGGDRTTVIPPAGSVTTTTLTDAHGNTTGRQQYKTPPAISGYVLSGGTHVDTSYHFTPLGLQDKITDSTGAVWSTSYDLGGRSVSQTDPDSGTTSSVYDDAGDLTQTTDADGHVIAYLYDNVSRKTQEWQNATTTAAGGTELASWTYDSVQKGRLSSTTRYAADGNYVTGYFAYDGQGDPAGSYVTVPSTSTTGLAGTYKTTYAWSTTHLLTGTTPAAGGGLPSETIASDHTAMGNPTNTIGYNAYASATSYTPYGQPTRISMGSSSSLAWLAYVLDPQTFRLSSVQMSAQSAAQPQIDLMNYAYDPSGNITSSTETVGGGTGAPTRTQCYTYNALSEVNAAWTATDNCAAAPNIAAGTANIGGPAPFWTSWTIGDNGQRSQQIQHGTTVGAGDSTTHYTYSYSPPGQPSQVNQHALAATATTGATPASASYTYDANGNTTGRTLPSGAQTLTWNAENRLDTITAPGGSTSYIYDADGNQLIRKDPTSNTLYLPGEELTRTTATSTTVGTRYYTHAGIEIALRVGGGNPQYLDPDPHGTNQITVDSSTYAATRRYFDPYGNPVAGGSGSWPDAHGYLDKPTSTVTGLTDIGARKYDASTGEFISVDPDLNPADPQSLNAYGYTSGDPVNGSDPTGQMLEGDPGNTDNSNGQGLEAAVNDAFSQFMAQTGPGTTVDYNKWRSWDMQGQPSGSFKDFLGGLVHGVTSLADVASPSCWSGLACTGKMASDQYNKTFDVNTSTLAYDGGNFTITALTLLAAPEADIFDAVDGAVTAGRAWRAARAARDVAGSGDDLTTVGRWMSPEEHGAMVREGIVQEGGGGTTYVAHPADPAAYGSQASSGSRYVEFDVPPSSLRPGGKEGWAQIPGPNSMYGRLAQMRGELPPQLPPASNITWRYTK